MTHSFLIITACAKWFNLKLWHPLLVSMPMPTLHIFARSVASLTVRIALLLYIHNMSFPFLSRKWCPCFSFCSLLFLFAFSFFDATQYKACFEYWNGLDHWWRLRLWWIGLELVRYVAAMRV